jgi:hypothetical protein
MTWYCGHYYWSIAVGKKWVDIGLKVTPGSTDLGAKLRVHRVDPVDN